MISGDSGGSSSYPGAGGLIGTGLQTYAVASRGGKGRMAARGAAASAQRLQVLGLLQSDYQFRQSNALNAFEAQHPGTPGQVLVFNADPKVLKLQKLIANVVQLVQTQHSVAKQKKLMKREAALEKKLAKRMLTTEGQADIRVSEIYGSNAGYWREHGAPQPLWLQRG